MFFNDWESIFRIIIVGALSYIGLIIMLRISGKRTLSKMNAFDFVVTVALGSILATILLSKDVVLAEGMTAFFVLIGLQYLVALFSVHFQKFGDLIKSNPRLLYYDGQFLHDAMKAERVTEVEILQAARSKGHGSMEEVDAIILETDGSVSVLQKSERLDHSTTSNVIKPKDF